MVVEYHNFVVVVGALDAEWSRALPTDASYEDAVWERMLDTHRELDKAATGYYESLEKNHQAWLEGQGGAVSDDLREGVDERLFTVQTWLPFGHLDALGLFAVDDIDAADAVIGRYKKTVEEVTTAYCPRMEPYRNPSPEILGRYGRASGDGRHLFAEFLDLMGERRGNSPDADCNPVSPQQRLRPLSIMSRLRLLSLLTMGRALIAQAAVYRLMADAVARAYRELAENNGDGPKPYPVDDIETVRICFMDLQDEEEIGLFVVGNNYSAMMAHIAAIQSLSIKDLLEKEPDAAYEIFACRGIRKVLNLDESLLSDPDAYLEQENLQNLRDCHLFRWSRGVAAASPHLSRADLGDRSDPVPTGEIGIETLVGIMLGHQADAEATLREIEVVESHLSAAGNRDSGYRLHTLGTDDLVLQWREPGDRVAGDSEDGTSKGLISIMRALAIWPQLLRKIGELPKKDRLRRDFTAWNSLISIPVPESDLFHTRVGQDHRIILHELMERIGDGSNLACLNDDRIWQLTRQCGLPVACRRPLTFLSKNFRQVTTNPLIFDLVLDFIDILETLSYVLCERLPETLERLAEHRPQDYSSRTSPEFVDQLNELLAALDDAFGLRLRRVYPEDPIREWSLDLRSQSHQILLSADAVLKCAVAVFRKDVLGILRDKLDDHPDSKIVRKRLGVVLRLKFHSGMKARYLKAFRLPPPPSLKAPDPRDLARLAVFEADFPHLRSVLVYADFYHESFHLIFEELAARENYRGLPSFSEELLELILQSSPEGEVHSGDSPDSALACRETFVHMLMLLFVFDGDRTLLIQDHLQALSQSAGMPDHAADQEHIDPDDVRRSRTRNFAELAFHAIAPIVWLESVLGDQWRSEEPSASTLCTMQKPEASATFATVAEFSEQVWRRIEANKGVFPDFEWVMGRPGTNDRARAENDLMREVGSLYAHTFRFLPEMWFAARAIFAHHATRIASEFLPSDDPTIAEEVLKTPEDRFWTFTDADPSQILEPRLAAKYQRAQREVDRKIQESWHGLGWKSAFSPVSGVIKTPDLSVSPGNAVDANLIIRRSLYHYLRSYRSGDEAGRQNSLPRSDDGTILFGKFQAEPYADFLIDRTAVNHFSCVPSARRRRTGHDIGVQKTLWGIASRNRARRLVSLVSSIGRGEVAASDSDAEKE